MKSSIDDGFLKCGCLEVVDAVGFQSTGMHSFILAHGSLEDLLKYSKLLRSYIYTDIHSKINQQPVGSKALW